MRQKFVITHPSDGVYLGNCMGLGFWSKLDPAGQNSAPLFSCPQEAIEHIQSWDGGRSPADYAIVPVNAVGPFHATIVECVKAGLDAWFPDGDYRSESAQLN